MPEKQLIKIAHSPDSDDAFMFYALKHQKISSDKYDFEIVRKDIEELNRLALDEVYDITAISIHAYAHLAHKYVLTSSGASMAEKDYGPMVVAKKDFDSKTLLKGKVIAVPGEWTTAFLVLKLYEPHIRHLAMPFDQIMDAVLQGKVDAGLLIHEGQLQFEDQGLKKILSLGDVWRQYGKGLPLPLGGNAVKKSLGKEVTENLSCLQKQSIEYAFEHKEEARDYAMQFKRDLLASEADKYLSWYANERTLNMGDEGKKAISLLFDLAHEKGLLEKKVEIEIV